MTRLSFAVLAGLLASGLWGADSDSEAGDGLRPGLAAIYSEGDGVAHWSFCVDEEDEFTENLHVPSSHLGMTHNPLIMYAIADRLGQSEGDWRPFRWIPHLKQRLSCATRALI